MIRLHILLIVVALTGCQTPSESDSTRAQNKLEKAQDAEDRFYALGDAAHEAFAAGKFDEARAYAMELKALTPRFPSNYNYGNAINAFNVVLGRLAMREGRMEEAKQLLFESAKTPGSPQLNSFGPNMSLANDFLNKGEYRVVLEYLDLCRRFWKLGNNKLNLWTNEILSGKKPDFGGNLIY